MAVTQKQIAQELGVSHQLVSFALNGSDMVAERTRDEILQVAERLGYRVNGSARTMRAGRFGCVAMLLSDEPHRSYAPKSLINGVHDELALHDQHLTIARLPDQTLTSEVLVPKILREWMADGLLIDYIRNIPPRLVELIARHQFPAIWINAGQPGDCVSPDNLGAGQAATRHLLELGHTRIAWVDFTHGSDLAQEHHSAGERAEGYVLEMHAAGLAPQIVRETQAVPPRERIERSRQLLAGPDRPEALVTYGSTEGGPLMIAAMSLGLVIPRDLSLVSFGDAETNFCGIPLTLMVEPDYLLGETAVKMLQEKIKAPAIALAARVLPFHFQPGFTSTTSM